MPEYNPEINQAPFLLISLNPTLLSIQHDLINREFAWFYASQELARVQEMEEAATRIQAVQRGRSTRRAVDNRRANQRALRQASCRRRRESSYFENARDQLGANSARDGADKDNQPMSSDAIAGEGQSTAVIDKRTAEAIATLIDDRIMVRWTFRRRRHCQGCENLRYS